jgi:flagellar assembly protein FliH
VVKSYLQYEVPPEVAEALKKAEAAGKTAARSAETETAIQNVLDEARQEAEANLREADASAAAILREAERQAENVRQQAEEAGYAAGYSAGLAQGETEAREAVLAEKAEAVEEIKALAAAMRAAREEVVVREEGDLIRIAMEAARKIMRQQCRVDGSAVSKMLEDIVRESDRPLRLYLSEFQNTLEFQLDKNITKKMRDFAGGLKTILVKDDDSIMLETETGVLDASIPSQLRILRDELTDDGRQ